MRIIDVARPFGLLIAFFFLSGPALAQINARQNTLQPNSPATAVETRRATTTTAGDTGLWFLPTGEVLPAHKWSISAYRVNFDYEQGFTDVSNLPLTWAVGVENRLELFGALTLVRRIDRDVRPLFFPTAAAASISNGGVVNEYPFATQSWTGNKLGDFWVGAKVNLTSERRQARAAFAVRGMVKVPSDGTVSTGKVDFALDAVLSKETAQRIELSSLGGFIVRSDPDQYQLLNGLRWGFGVGFPTRKSLRLTVEVHGEEYFGNAVELQVPSILPPASEQDGPLNVSLGLTWLGARGLFAGAGLTWNLRLNSRSDFGSFQDETGDALGLQIRVGYHRGVLLDASRGR